MAKTNIATRDLSGKGSPTRPSGAWVQQVMLFAALFLSLAQYGLWGFPVRLVPNPETGKFDKKPLVKWKPLQRRRPTRKEITDWFARFHRCAIGLPTGRKSGFFVIDVDCPRARKWLLRRGEIATWTVKTRRGWHYYFRYPTFKVGNSAGALARGIDVRGDGGYVVGAGSFSGKANYAWVEGRSPADVALAEAPTWLLEKLRHERVVASAGPPIAPQPYRGYTTAWAQAAYDGEIERLRTASVGTRHTTFVSVARRLGQLCAGGELDQAQVLRALYYIADHWSTPKKSYEAIEWAFAHGLEAPRRAPESRICSDIGGNLHGRPS